MGIYTQQTIKTLYPTMDSETELLKGLIELQYGQNVEKKLRHYASSVSWMRGWPDDTKAFWNAEAYMWQRKISPEVRGIITQELAVLRGGKNLDLGCGAYSYIPSVGLDIAPKMLQFNGQCTRKIVHDLEERLPVEDGHFDSVTAVFVLNYIRRQGQLLQEVKRVLRPGGTLAVVLSSLPVNGWQRQKEVATLPAAGWRETLTKAGFAVEFYRRQKLWFFRCRKEKGY